ILTNSGTTLRWFEVPSGRLLRSKPVPLGLRFGTTHFVQVERDHVAAIVQDEDKAGPYVLWLNGPDASWRSMEMPEISPPTPSARVESRQDHSPEIKIVAQDGLLVYLWRHRLHGSGGAFSLPGIYWACRDLASGQLLTSRCLTDADRDPHKVFLDSDHG